MSAGNVEISVVLLTYHGESYLAEVLKAIFTQTTRFSFEVVAIDSGSSDRTLEILENYPIRIIQIPNREFGHGRTRNFGAQNTLGRYVVYLTQDATPVNENWLENLVRPLVEDQRVAGAYSRQIPRPDCNPSESRDIGIGTGPLRTVKRVDLREPFQKKNYEAFQSCFISFSNVSSCIRRDVLDNLPFSERIVMVEDQEWCKRAIESGYWIVYEPTSSVYHSHNHSLRMIYKRHYDYGASLREFTPLHMSIRSVLFYTVFEAISDAIFIFRQRMSVVSTFEWILKTPIVRFAMRYGLYKGLCGTIQAPVAETPEVLTNETQPSARR